MREFDLYEVVGVVAPGMVIVIGGVCLFFPDQHQQALAIGSISVGSIGVGLVLAYVVGQLLHVVGTIVEDAWWRLWSGRPTDWVQTNKRRLIAKGARPCWGPADTTRARR